MRQRGANHRRSSLLGQDLLCARVYRVCLLRTIADRGQADAAVLTESAHHVEDNARLACLVEMDLVAGDNVEQIVVGDPAEQRGLEVVGRDHVFFAAARSGEEGCDGVVASAGEELERQERMRRSTLAEVELDRVRTPCSAVVPRDDEVDGEPSEHTSRASRLPTFSASVVIDRA